MKMKCIKLKIGLFIFLCTILSECRGDLSLSGIPCGSKVCKSQEYCSKFDRQCAPCSNICNPDHHNYEATLCRTDCQDYIHDSLYVRRNEKFPGKKEDLREVVQRLQFMVTVCLTLTCIALIIILTMVSIQIYQWKGNNNITFASLRSKFCSKKNESNKVSSTNGVTMINHISGKPELRLDMPTVIGTQSEHSPATLSTCISRRPAEDSALDYAYDNRAMSSSPSPNTKPHESNM